jgi:NAD(P)-dependent dehydrogenase (short-subunit alcohol dehydrogenase family)
MTDINNVKIALVTGGNKGIGFEIVRGLAQAGCKVYLGARNAELGKEAAAQFKDEGDVSFIELDLNDQGTLDAASAKIEGEHGRLDILVNNAAIAIADGEGSPSQAEVSTVEQVMKTNFVGTFAVTRTFLPLVKKSSAGRIVNVSSPLGSLKLNGEQAWNYFAYGSSKAALNMLTVQLAYELRDTAIKVNSANPGYTATALNNFQGHETPEQGAAEAIRLSLIGDDGPTGTASSSEGITPW